MNDLACVSCCYGARDHAASCCVTYTLTCFNEGGSGPGVRPDPARLQRLPGRRRDRVLQGGLDAANRRPVCGGQRCGAHGRGLWRQRRAAIRHAVDLCCCWLLTKHLRSSYKEKCPRYALQNSLDGITKTYKPPKGVYPHPPRTLHNVVQCKPCVRVWVGPPPASVLRHSRGARNSYTGTRLRRRRTSRTPRCRSAPRRGASRWAARRRWFAATRSWSPVLQTRT
jgi:hypothetical protein